jgi:hypothetical protein
MLNRKLFKQTFFLLFVVAVLNFFADTLYLFRFIWWFDILLHFLAGGVVAMAWILTGDFVRGETQGDKNRIILIAIFSALVIGILWEIYELYFDITGVDEISHGMSYVVDTAKDIVMDLSGGLFGGLYGLKVISKK